MGTIPGSMFSRLLSTLTNRLRTSDDPEIQKETLRKLDIYIKYVEKMLPQYPQYHHIDTMLHSDVVEEALEFLSENNDEYLLRRKKFLE